MNHVLYAAKPLRLADHRLLWWLLAHQLVDERGIPTGEVPRGWRTKVIKELKISRRWLWFAQERLKKAGLIILDRYARKVRINGDAFEFPHERELNFDDDDVESDA